MKNTCQLLTPKTTYTFDYPQAIEFADLQNDHFWLADEITVEKDIQDIKVNMTEAEQHGVITTLKLFTLYEIHVGSDYWSGVVAKKFPRPDIERMANCFSFFEINVHAPFYNKLNEALNINTDEFYNSYLDDPVLKDRMDFIDEMCNPKDLPLSIGVFSLVEGAVLYSSFAFLKHFQAQGKNKIKNIVSGINFSIRDENIHHEGGAWLFRTLLDELEYTNEERDDIHSKVSEAAKKIYEHECKIIDKIFEKGKIDGITDVQMKNFVESRINLCLQNLGIKTIFDVNYNPINKWFYKNITTIQFHDFFAGVGNSYNRNWDEGRFKW